MDDPPAKRLRQRTKVEYEEKKLSKMIRSSALTSLSLSTNRKIRGIIINCFCGKHNKNKITYCYGPLCPWKWVHLKCIGLKTEPVERVFCSEKCKDDEQALLANENAVLREYDWCSCRKQRGGPMVACGKKGCPNEWYHLVCVGLKVVPKHRWICPECKQKCEMKAAKRKPNKVEAPPADISDLKPSVDFKDTVAVKNEIDNADFSKGYCICKKKPDDSMIECTSPKCPQAWFHLSCVHMTAFPEPDSDWCCSTDCYKMLNDHLKNSS